jgi:hypothetical protein
MLYNSILHWTNSDNIQPIGVFLEKPDKKTYPDYYEIISEPIDMNTIDSKINRNMYRSVCCCVGGVLTDSKESLLSAHRPLVENRFVRRAAPVSRQLA